MTTKFKRLTISLPPEVDEAVTALAKVQDKPQSKVIMDVLIEFAPQMVYLAKLYAQIKAGEKAGARQTVSHMLGDQMASLFAEQLELKGMKK
jgi:predicted transcriptional regulator